MIASLSMIMEPKEIAAAAMTQCGLELDKKKIQLPEAIKALGIYEVNVRLHTKVTGRVSVIRLIRPLRSSHQAFS